MSKTVESISFCVLGQPVPKGRPRFCNGVAVTPKRTRDYERLVRDVAALHCGNWRRDGLYRVTLKFVFEGVPRGDLDNYLKAQLDAMQGYAFDNDRQVFAVNAQWEMHALHAFTDVLVERIGDMPAKKTRKKGAA